MTQSNTEKIPLTVRENFLAREVIDIAFKLHKALGPGVLESVYAKCFYYELEKRGIPFTKEQMVTLHYEDLIIENGLKLGILVENLLILELKAQENFHPVWEAQLLSYLN